jgi:gas vesicle protein
VNDFEKGERMRNDGWASFFLGLGIGVGVGILIAPKSGEETRDILRAKADEGKEYLKKQTAGLRESATELADDLKERGEDLVSRGKDVIGRQKDVLSDAIEAGRQAYRDKVDPNSSTQSA